MPDRTYEELDALLLRYAREAIAPVARRLYLDGVVDAYEYEYVRDREPSLSVTLLPLEG